MKLSGRTDVQAPVEFVFDAISDFDFWERAALRRGAEVTRTDKLRQPAPGMSWMIRFGWRGRERQMHVVLKKLERPQVLAIEGDSPSVEGVASIELVALSATRVRLLVQTTIKPRTLAARLFVQSMRLARGKVAARYDKKLRQLATIIEQRYEDSRRG
jgi:uncharacterized protein YndB with AHSA1/START domain